MTSISLGEQSARRGGQGKSRAKGPPRSRSSLARYGVALIAVVLATALRLSLDPLLGESVPFPTLFFAVLIAVWFGGFGPAVAATFAGALLAAFFLIPPRNGFSLGGLHGQAGMLLYLGVALGIAFLGGAMAAARRRAQRLAAEAVDSEQQRRRLAAIVESSDDAILSKTLDGAITSWNEGAERLYGYPLAEVIGKPVSMLVPPERAAETRSLMQKLKRGEWTEHFETVRRRKDGSLVDVSVNISPVRNDAGELIGASTIARDITERRRVEGKLRCSEQELAEFFENASVPLHWIGPDGVILRANRAELELLGYARDEYVGRNIAEFHADPETIGEIMRRLERGETLRDCAARLRCKDGSIKDVVIDSSAMFDEGRFVHTRCFTRDVTRQRAAEEALRDSERDLRDADRRKDHFLAVLAHELRNPLAPVRNALHVLKRAAPDSAAAAEARDMAERQVHHLTRLVDDLLDVSRIMNGKITLRRERVDLATVVARAVEAARPAIDAKGHELRVSLPREPILLDADVVRLAQVLSNLLNNASRYTEAGGLVWIAAEPAGGEVLIRVGDSGVGLDPEELTRIFDLFTQAAPGEFRTQGGLGIGLTLVRTLVEMHDGAVEARSAGRGRGSEFVVRLPLAVPVPLGAAVDATRSPAPAPPGRRVLVVDDNVDAAESLAMVLRLEGHDVEVAHSGLSALAAARTKPPECVLLDIGMPGMDGYEVARTLRVEPGMEHVTLVALTGWGQEEDRQRSRQAGFDHHLTKPVEPTTLQAVLGEGRRAAGGS